MANYTKTADNVIMAHALSTNPATAVGSAFSVANDISGTFFFFVGFIEAASNANPQIFKLQASASATNDEDWIDIVKFTIQQTGTPAREQLTGASLADTTMEVASTAGFTADMACYIEDSSVLANGEWNHVSNIVTDTSVDIYTAPVNAKDSADFINEAELYIAQLDLSSITRVRGIFENEGATGVDCHYKLTAVTADSIA